MTVQQLNMGRIVWPVKCSLGLQFLISFALLQMSNWVESQFTLHPILHPTEEIVSFATNEHSADNISDLAQSSSDGVPIEKTTTTEWAPSISASYEARNANTETVTSKEITSMSDSSAATSPSITTVKTPNMTNISTSTSNPNNDNRFRWVDFRRNQAFPPRIPGVPGIPSGFRNSVAPTATSAQPTSPMYNPGAHNNNFLGGSNSNTVSFAGSVITEDESPFKVTNTNRRYNITRVEHIVAECSDEYMKVVVRFNGTFSGIIYSSGYVHDPNCIYVNGSGRSYYEFFIRLNQCGTLGRQEMYHPTMPGEARRRDQLMWNTLSIQYNALIEEEFDEHFRLTCEYGSDFWKTVSFPSVNVEINTGSPVVFTINPPQCQMEIRRGFGIAGTRTSGPVTVGDPLTLLIHMKSEKTGFDILVKNCVAHNGAQQRMQLIDANGCVTNEKLISPFRGTFNTENGHQVSLYSYLKAFRFTGSPALYLECDIHMCHNRCPPQRCYWRNLSKRSLDESSEEHSNVTTKPILSESISLYQALEVYHEQDEQKFTPPVKSRYIDENLVCLRSGGLAMIMMVFVCLMGISIGSAICYCLRMRRVKYLSRNLLHSNEYSTRPPSMVSPSIGSEYSAFTTTNTRDRFFRMR